jgi:hypothetical protein
MNIEKIELSGGLNSGDNQVLEKTIEIALERLYFIAPGLVLECSWAEEIVEAHSTFRDLNLAQ